MGAPALFYAGIRGDDMFGKLLVRGTDARLTVVLLALLCIPGLTSLKAQTSSVIVGTLTDPQGNAIVGAVIFLSGSGLVGETRFLSDSSGSYRLPGLPAGIYNLRVSKPGFAIRAYTGLTVAVN